jgi:4-amino-4-deoxy-L-arabinose transferase-like glycosyltransferase
MAQYHPFSPKLGFNYVTAVVMAFIGYDVMAATYVEAAFGVLMVGAIFLLVGAVRNDRAGLVAAGMLTLSCYHLYFSRNAYPQCCSVFFVITAVWCHLKWYGRSTQGRGGALWLVCCGALAGLSFWVNYQVAGALPFLPLLHALACVRRGTGREKIVRFLGGGIAISAGFLLVMATAEAASYPMILLYRTQGLQYPHNTFFELLWPRVVGQTAKPFNLSGLLLFPFFVARLEGWGGLIVAGLLSTLGGWLLRNRRRAEEAFPRSETLYVPAVYLGIPFVVPFLVFSLKTMQGARMFTSALPFFIGLLAVVVDAAWITEHRRRRVLRVCVVAMLVVAGGSSLLQWREVFGIRSAYPQLVAFLGEDELDATVAPWSAVFDSYRIAAKWDENGPPVGPRVGDAEAKYFVNDWQQCYFFGYPDQSSVIPEEARVVKTFEHEFGRLFLEVETFPSNRATLENIRWVRERELERSRKLLVCGKN